MTRFRQESDPRFPFGLRGLDFADEGMQVTNERFTQLFNACVLRATHTGEHRFGDRRFVKVAHSYPSWLVLSETPYPRLVTTNLGWRPVRVLADWDRAYSR